MMYNLGGDCSREWLKNGIFVGWLEIVCSPPGLQNG
jgi:hypothetical protein